MGRARVALACLFLAAFFTLQLSLTALGRNWWPFCSYDLFAFQAPLRTSALRVALHESDGSSRIEPPGRVVPLEFFRARQVLFDALVRSEDEERARRVSRRLVHLLNERPWRAFDETLGPARPGAGRRFVAFDLLLLKADLGSYRYPEPVPVSGSQLLYTFVLDE